MLKPSATTIVISLIVLAFVVCMIYAIFHVNNVAAQLLLGLLVVGLLALPIFRMPIAVKENAEKIRVRYVVGGRTFRKKKYEISDIEKNDLGSITRVFGSGGFGGFIGWFKSSNIGSFYAMCVNQKSIILLKNKKTGKQYIIDKPV